MVKFQRPIIFRDKKATTLQEDQTSQQLRQEGGFTRIKGTEDLSSRILFADTFFVNVESVYRSDLTELLKKAPSQRTPEEVERLNYLQDYLVMFEAYRACKKCAMAWCVANEDEDMSRRFSSFETFFTRNWKNPQKVKTIIEMAMYLVDLSFKELHVAPAPTIMIQNYPKGSQINLGLSDGESAEEKVKE